MDATVTISFSIRGEKVNNISSNLDQKFDLNRVHDDAVNSNTSFEYSGRHDHGKLPMLLSSTAVTDVIASLYDAKIKCDRYLTECINIEYGNDSQPNPKKLKSNHDV